MPVWDKGSGSIQYGSGPWTGPASGEGGEVKSSTASYVVKLASLFSVSLSIIEDAALLCITSS